MLAALLATTALLATPQPMVGPECAPPVRDAVIAAVAGRAQPGQVIQYLQVQAGQLVLCVVIVPTPAT
jgi:hypothetical protein